MTGLGEVDPRVSVGRRVATTDVAAGQAHPQVSPRGDAQVMALLTHRRRGEDRLGSQILHVVAGDGGLPRVDAAMDGGVVAGSGEYPAGR